MRNSVLLIGDIMRDIIVKPDGALRTGSDRGAKIAIKPGGAAASQAVWLAAGEVKTKLVARVGCEDFDELVASFKKKNVTPIFSADAHRQTGILVSLISPDGERSFYTDRGANLDLDISDIPAGILDDCALVMLSGYSFFAKGPRSVVKKIMLEAKKLDIPVAIDPASAGFIEDVGVEQFIKWTKGAAILLPNSEEAALLSGQKTLAGQLDDLGQFYDQVVIKQGAKGASAMDADGEIIRVSAPRIRVVDTTGAGDAFGAGFIVASLRGSNIRQCLEAGVAQGSLAASQIGSQPA